MKFIKNNIQSPMLICSSRINEPLVFICKLKSMCFHLYTKLYTYKLEFTGTYTVSTYEMVSLTLPDHLIFHHT